MRQDITDNKPLLDRLNKLGSAIAKLVGDEDKDRISQSMEEDNARFDAIKRGLRERSNSLDEALQHTSAVSGGEESS